MANSKTPRQKQAEKTKGKIFKTAVTLMERKGFDNITIAEISNKAGVSVGAFYHYFHSKFDIFQVIFEKADEYFQKHIADNIIGGNTIDKIINYFDHYAHFNDEIVGFGTVCQIYNVKNKQFIKKKRKLTLILEDIIKEGLTNGDIVSDMKAEEIAQYFFIMARGTVFHWCLSEGACNLQDIMHKNISHLVKVFQP